MLMRNERLAALDSRFDDASQLLTIRKDGADRRRGDLETAAGRAAIEDFFADEFSAGAEGPAEDSVRPRPQLFRRRQQGRLDHQSRQRRARSRPWSAQPVHPLRFRANLYVKGWPAWSRTRPGRPDARDRRGPAQGGQAHRPLRRPSTSIPRPPRATSRSRTTLMRRLGHIDCGIYAEVDRRRRHWRRRRDRGGSSRDWCERGRCPPPSLRARAEAIQRSTR